MPGFDPTSAKPFQSTGFDPVSATPLRAPGATGLGAVGQLVGDLLHPESANHDPNALEQGIMNVSQNPLIRGAKATFQQAATTGLFAEPTRAAMEGLGIGRRPNETNESLHQRYNQALIAARQQATADADAARIGAPAKDQKPTLAQRGERLGQQAINLGSNIVANPEYFLLPGMGVGGNAATRIATAGAGNAAIGNVSDDAAQLMDMAEGVKKDFDVKQNLEATITSGLFGAGMHGAIEVAPFVRDLFAKRGVDTKPAADPRGSPITPMSTDHVAVNQADAVQYKQVLQTGSVDDIKEFFKGRNGPQPSWQDVNTWVEHRDAQVPNAQHTQPNFDYEAEYNKHAENQYNEQNRSAVEQHVTNQMAGWKNAPEVEVVHGPDDIEHPEIRAQAQQEDANGDALGFLGSDGKVRLFSGRITDPDTANAVLFHEGLGHFGLAEKFGSRLDQTIKTMLERNVNQFSRETNAWMKRNPGAYGGDRVRAAEEVLAEASEKGQIPLSWKNALSSSIRQFGRKMGLKLAYSDAEVQHILAMAHDAVVNGKPSAAANGFRGAKQDQNKYMFTGPKARSFDPEHPTAYEAQDGHVRNEINDRQAKFKPILASDDLENLKLSDVLHHPELFDQYPQLRDLKVKVGQMDDAHGYYDTSEPHIGLDIDANVGHLLHEVQHAIQHIEGHIEQGEAGSAHMAMDDYLADPRELEAESTRERQLKTGLERLVEPPKFITRSQLEQSRERAGNGYKATDDDLESIVQHLEANYTPNKVSDAEVRSSALEYGITPSKIKDLRQRDPGELAARVARIGMAADYASMKARNLLDKLDTPDWSLGDQVELAKIIAERNYLIARFKGESNELGRALRATRAFQSYKNDTIAEISEKLHNEEASGLAILAEGGDEALKFARQLKKALASNSNPKGAQALMNNVSKPYWEQYLNTFHMNMMLSALSTHVKAPVDMATGISREVIERALAIPVSKARQMIEGLTGKQVNPGVEYAELEGQLYGIIRSISDAEVYRRAAHAAITGEGSYVDASGKAVPVNFMHQYGSTSNPDIPGIGIPSHLINAQDTFFRSVAMNQNLYALGRREARLQLGPKASIDDVRVLGDNLARNPTPTMLKEAVDLSNRALLLNHNPLNNMLDKWRSYRPGLTPWERVGRFVVFNLAPFIRVESNNLINRVIQRSPMAFLDPYTQKQLKMGGAQADIAMTKILYGTVLLGMYWVAADKAKDKLMGAGPDSPDKFKEAQAAGFTPRSVHENGRYNVANSLAMSINPFDVHNATATMVAEMREAYEKGTNKGQVGTGLKLSLASLMYNLADMSWVSDVAPVIDALQAHGQEGATAVGKFVSGEARSWMPNLMSQMARLNDPNARDTKPTDPDSISEQTANELQSTIPGMREKLPIKYSVYGTPLQNGASITGVHTWIPGLNGNGTTETHDPAERELDRLNTLIPGALITPVTKTITLDDDTKKKLTPAEFEEYQRVAGRAIVETVRQEMSTSEWQRMSDQDKVLEVRDIQTDMKQAAREALFDQ